MTTDDTAPDVPADEVSPEAHAISDFIIAERERTAERADQRMANLLGALMPHDPEQQYAAGTMQVTLNQAQRRIISELGQLAQAHPSLLWLWYLRRMPLAAFRATNPDHSRECARLAVIAAGRSRNTSFIRLPEEGWWATTDGQAILREVLFFCYMVHALFRIHNRLTFAGLGVPFITVEDDLLPEPRPEDWFQAALDAYKDAIRREDVSHGLGPLVRMGTRIEMDVFDLELYGPQHVMGVRSMSNDGTRATLVRQPDNSYRAVRLMYAPVLLNLSQLRSLTHLDPWNRRHERESILPRDDVWWHDATGAVLLMLRLMATLAITSRRNGQEILMQLQDTGYVWVDESSFLERIRTIHLSERQLISAILPHVRLPTTPERLVARLAQVQGQLWPPQDGPLVYRNRRDLFLDLAAMTERLEMLLEFGGRTQSANLIQRRSMQFERLAQAKIDATPWCAPELVQYQGRKLRRPDGTDMTDIDAIGAYGSTLLLVDCKSAIYSDAYARALGGNLIDNLSSELGNTKAANWRDVVNELTGTKKGPNYDFRAFDKIVGVVCTPHPALLYHNLAAVHEHADKGLRRVVTLQELISWCQR